MSIIEILNENSNLRIKLPITAPTGKTRVKIREAKNEFGQSYSVKQNVITNKCYIEWQIS